MESFAMIAYYISVTAQTSPVGKIKHVVVLMEENRAFDHIFGYSATPEWPLDGLTGRERNPVSTTNMSLGHVGVSADCPMINECDPNHGTPATTSKIFGAAAASQHNYSVPRMDGFVEWEATHADAHYCDVMRGFAPGRLPVIAALAQEYALFDRFFCSHPGPTWPNRMYTLSGTSAGSTETGTWYLDVPGQLFPQRTFFDQLAAEGRTWKNYYNDTPWEMFMETIAHHPEHTRPLSEFFADAANGNLPTFSWINPSSGINLTTGIASNDQHPDHDMAAGEQHYKAVYEALRAGPGWNDTLFILTYDVRAPSSKWLPIRPGPSCPRRA